MLLHFHQLGYTPVQLAFLFLLYEFFGIVTNLVGGWLAARTGLRFTLVLGLVLQVVALGLLALLNRDWSMAVSVAYVMGCQALSGIAKDLTKMSAKSAVKVLVPQGDESGLFKWVAVLTGSKNALKGAGFFVGGVAAVDARIPRFARGDGGWRPGGAAVRADVPCRPRSGRRRRRRRSLESCRTRPASIGCRWLGWRSVRRAGRVVRRQRARSSWRACWAGRSRRSAVHGAVGDRVRGRAERCRPVLLRQGHRGQAPGPALAATLGARTGGSDRADSHRIARRVRQPAITMLGGLALFGVVFALNSSVHSYLVLAYSEADRVSLSVGFYYMANACGTAAGNAAVWCALSGGRGGASLWGAVVLAAAAGIGAMFLPPVAAAVSWAGAKGDD